jgi:23S rRNA pseudouridine955/2504/2580 synthase
LCFPGFSKKGDRYEADAQSDTAALLKINITAKCGMGNVNIAKMSKKSESPSPAVRHVTVDETREGQRLDNFLVRELKGVPKSRVYRIVRKGEVRVNGSRAKPDYRLQTGDSIRLPPVRVSIEPTKPKDAAQYAWLEDAVLFEDAHLLVISKPAGLAVHGGTGLVTGLIEALRLLRPQNPGLELVHRLDRETSGCLVLAKDRRTLLDLHEALKAGRVRKHYTALLMGKFPKGRREVSAAITLEREQGRRHMRVDEAGKESASVFTTKAFFPNATLVDIELLTGRTHQARVHATHLKHPIAGDDKYGDWDFNKALRKHGLKRLFLHAARISFQHPVTSRNLNFEAPLPDDLQTVVENLERDA